MKKDFDKLTDRELIDKFNKTRKMIYYDKFFFRYYALIVGKYRNKYEADQQAIDAVNEALLKLRDEKKLPQKDNIEGWFCKAVTNKIIDYHRKINGKKCAKITFSLEDKNNNFMEKYEYLRNDNEDVLDEVIVKARKIDKVEQCIYDCMKKIDDKQSKCIKAYFWDKKSYNEISIQYGFDQKKVKSYIQNGKRNIRNCIENKMNKLYDNEK
ncbi:MAG: sigma-70 family RNA polymerase sigma factor [Bacteroidales bacterium]|nr:sigma-70 family RNA polymerase sigma factor [Bacteroidales bacterium]